MHGTPGLQQAHDTRESGGIVRRKYQPVWGLQPTYSRMSTVRPLRIISKQMGDQVPCQRVEDQTGLASTSACGRVCKTR
ncbi:hypothetical protein L798_15540 [Zootermopsis nevadensis]|uniref:Uncharacterized protein n=1 Tax=Zootermopsis nevadensis TaxID=136037 RepID=A0A067QWX6_ZOONE|nr:hypothetical protein L798_15540 [Zootermopsis nevadensis]